MIIETSLRDHLFLSQVLFICGPRERGGRGVEATENGKLVEKPEENRVGGSRGGSTNIKLEEYIQNLRKRWSKYIKFSSFHFKILYFTKGGVTVITA